MAVKLNCDIFTVTICGSSMHANKCLVEIFDIIMSSSFAEI